MGFDCACVSHGGVQKEWPLKSGGGWQVRRKDEMTKGKISGKESRKEEREEEKKRGRGGG
jgi:hypothetical protein